jgi:DNA-binding PadR family transcriptional regulator
MPKHVSDLLSPVMLQILLAVSEEGKHGYAIMKDVGINTKGRIKLGPGTLYGAIKRMLELSMIEEIEGDDPRRRIYQITSQGKKLLRQELRDMQQLLKLNAAKKLLGASS